MKKSFQKIIIGIMVIIGCTIFLDVNQATAQTKKSKKWKRKFYLW